MDSKKIIVLGSTGSIGRQALEVISWFPERFNLVGLAANSNAVLLEEQVLRFNVPVASIADPDAARDFEQRCRGRRVNCLRGADGLRELAGMPEADLVLVSVSGIAGLAPTLEAIKGGKTVALANKETLVAGGHLVMGAARSQDVRVIPVDSEHSAIDQCLQQKGGVSRLIITGSGGPFRGMIAEQLRDVSPEAALKHPTWSMGAKITIDSATLMNKGLEIIEARWLFDVDYSCLEVLIHPQSVVHGLVCYRDGMVMAQLGCPDMRAPIQYALCYPEHVANFLEPLDLAKTGQLTFERPDLKTFRCLSLAMEAGRAGGSMTAVLNAANEVAVRAFLKRELSFLAIPEVVERVMTRHAVINSPGLAEILEVDAWARQTAEQMLC